MHSEYLTMRDDLYALARRPHGSKSRTFAPPIERVVSRGHPAPRAQNTRPFTRPLRLQPTTFSSCKVRHAVAMGYNAISATSGAYGLQLISSEIRSGASRAMALIAAATAGASTGYTGLFCNWAEPLDRLHLPDDRYDSGLSKSRYGIVHHCASAALRIESRERLQ